MADTNPKIIKCFLDKNVYPFSGKPLFMAIGTFDGVHLGHGKLLSTTVTHANKQNGVAVAYTFSPHPTFITCSNNPKPMICTLDRKYELIGKHEIGTIIEQYFDQQFSKITPYDFVKYLKTKFPSLRNIFIGENFRFGCNRAGDANIFKNLFEQENVDVTIFPQVTLNGERISSSMIRKLFHMRNFELANSMLGAK